MILSDADLKACIQSGELGVEPFEPQNLQPASLDCRLDCDFESICSDTLDCIRMDEALVYKQHHGVDSIKVPPRSFLLGSTREYIRLPDNMTAFVEGRSSIGRMGLFIQNAGWVDPGFEGSITLELYNATHLPIVLKPGRRICQMVFCKMQTSTTQPYRGKYFKQRSVTGSRAHQETDWAVRP